MEKVKEDINFWLQNINALNGYHIKQNYAVTKIVYSDASEQGYGGYVVQKMGEKLPEATSQKRKLALASPTGSS